jgi:hypothetical protein
MRVLRSFPAERRAAHGRRITISVQELVNARNAHPRWGPENLLDLMQSQDLERQPPGATGTQQEKFDGIREASNHGGPQKAIGLKRPGQIYKPSNGALRPVLLYNAAAWSRKDRWCEDVH